MRFRVTRLGRSFDKAVETHGLLKRGQSVVLGLSGGPDSAALFHLLACSGLGLTLYPVHVNHGLRGSEADRDEAFCKDLCERVSRSLGKGCELTVYKADIKALAKERKRSVEETGRDFRYRAFEEARAERNADVIAVAHNRDDNAETVIMRFFRGTGVKGLAGIPVKRGNIIRPLLLAGRDEILEYCDKFGLEYCEDSTNADEGYTRNWVRRTLLPLVENRLNPRAAYTVTEAAGLLDSEDEFLDKLADGAYENCVSEDGGLDTARLAALDAVLARRVLRKAYGCAARRMRDFGKSHVDSLLALILGPPGKALPLPGGVTARKTYGCLYFSTEKARDYADFAYQTDLMTPLMIPERSVRLDFKSKLDTKLEIKEKDFKKQCTMSAKCDMIKGNPIIRTRLPGDWMMLGGRRRDMKYTLRSLGIGAEERNALFYMAFGSEITAIMSAYGFIVKSDELDGAEIIITDQQPGGLDKWAKRS
ncbi:MAG: tRNA lysidine(34) synthetase TilS [Clostridiales bacterium]|nr:tRNA lysidine(34) synthetase TilS [Clostridiales bacterium]